LNGLLSPQIFWRVAYFTEHLMIKNTDLIKNNVTLSQIQVIKAFAELGATKKLFEVFWAGQYIRIIDTALVEYQHSLPFEKSIKIGATSWLSGRVIENNAYLVYAIYKEIAPDNVALIRNVSPEELSLVTSIYNIKYHSSSPLIITKIYSLLNGLIKSKAKHDNKLSDKLEGISFHNCACGNTFIARQSTVTATCQWCRSKIKKLIPKGTKHYEPPYIDISSISRMIPSS
jgi:hypothetical protein